MTDTKTSTQALPQHTSQTFVLKDFAFVSGESIPELRQHVITLGEARKNAAGAIENAVLLIHNTTGTAKDWLEPALAGVLFGPGQPLDATKYFLIMPDMIGFGGSGKPSDGMRARFPHYRFQDMVAAQHRVLTEHLGVSHLRLMLGLSMGGMLTWMFGGTHPEFMDALVPIASQPGPMSGRNWIQRRVNVEVIRSDPDWNGGDYEKNPTRWILTAPIGALMTQSVVRIQERAPTREKADALYRQFVERASKGDANNRLYQLESSMDYDPTPSLHRIKAPLLAINFADDALNPPELNVLEPVVAKIPGARSITIPAGPDTQGHYTAGQARFWASHLGEFLRALP